MDSTETETAIEIQIQNKGTDEVPFGFIYCHKEDTRILFSKDGFALSAGWGQPTIPTFKKMVEAVKAQPWGKKIKIAFIGG
jgi:hypothetical protein